MTNRRLSAFIDALVSGRRPGRFSAGPDDVEVLRTAIALRAARPGDAKPDEEFVSGLYEELASQARPQLGRNVRPVKFSRGRAVLVAAAASVVLVAGTASRHRGVRPEEERPRWPCPPRTDRSCGRRRLRRRTIRPWARSSPIAAIVAIRRGCS